MADNICQLRRSRFSRCAEPSTDSCQYCGSRFCTVHTHFRELHDAVCTRKTCVAKHEDLVVHSQYKQRVGPRTTAGLCGVEDCGPHPPYECSLCHGLFCGKHVSGRRYPFFEGRIRVDRLVSVCERCWGRRKIWAVR